MSACPQQQTNEWCRISFAKPVPPKFPGKTVARMWSKGLQLINFSTYIEIRV